MPLGDGEEDHGLSTMSRLYCCILLISLIPHVIAEHDDDDLTLQHSEYIARKLLTLDGKELYHNDFKPNFVSKDINFKVETMPEPGPVKTNDLKPKKKSRKARPYPTGRPRPLQESKRIVEWFEDTHYYALRASSDTRFRIRHGPIPASGTPWPLPQLYQTDGVTRFPISTTDFQFHAVGENCDILEYNFVRMREIMFGDSEESSQSFMSWAAGSSSSQAASVVHYLNVTVLKECDMDALPSLDMEESYDLEVKRSGASIIAREVWGALRGMETFSQLVYTEKNGLMYVNKTYIHDYPRFKHRGVLLDTSRHFLSKETILNNLEALAMNKMNVFHWHIVDDQSFPFQSKTFPDLSQKGAYDPVTHIYSHDDIKEILEFARLRGIRVIPEFDTPGHTYSWGYGQDHLLTPCYDYARNPDGFFGPINPILKSTYRLLRQLFTEILQLFPDKYMHLGGDEVPFDCWASNPYLLSFMRRNNLTDVKDLLHLYERELLKIVSDIGSKRAKGSGYILWQEVFDNGIKVKPDSIIQIWNGDTYDVDRVTSAGLRAIFSSCWYLDYIGYGQDWDKYYRCEQIGAQMDEYNVRNQHLLIGGEACLWTEYADDEVLMARLWPRASAAAERLWSHKDVMDVDAAAPRIEEHRCRMIRRGLKVGVLSGPGYCQSSPASTKRQQNNLRRSIEDHTGLINHNRPRVDLVSMQSMYVVPSVILVVILLLAFLARYTDSSHRTALIALPSISLHRRGVRGILFIFMVFVMGWFVWTSPIWLHTWEKHNPRPSDS